MKKIVALLMALLMALSASALAENEIEAVEESSPTTLEVGDILDFTIQMDALPEGYALEVTPIDGDLYASFYKDDESCQYLASVAYSELFDIYTLKIEELTEEELEQMKAFLSGGYNDPVFSFDKTAHGTDVILINENGAGDDYAEYITIYEGYFVSVAVVKDSELTEEDLAIALKLMSDLWIVPAN